jgi:hypothetical protein
MYRAEMMAFSLHSKKIAAYNSEFLSKQAEKEANKDKKNKGDGGHAAVRAAMK